MGAIKATTPWAGGTPFTPGKVPLWRREMLRIFRDARLPARVVDLPPSLLDHFRGRPRALPDAWAEIRRAAQRGGTTPERVIEWATRWVFWSERMRWDEDLRPPDGGP